MGGDCDHAGTGVLQTMAEFTDEQEVCKLALEVGPPRGVRLLVVQIVEVDLAGPVALAADRHDAGPFRGHQRWQQTAGQCEIAEVVDAELHLEALRGVAQRYGHQAGIVDQDVQAVVIVQELVGRSFHRVEVAQIHFENFDCSARVGGLDSRHRVMCLGSVAAGENHGGALAGKGSGAS